MTSEIRVNKLTNRVGLGTVEYTNTGIVVSGISTSDNFKTGTSNLHSTGLNVQDLDVDGHTNLDNVSIAGVTTTTENIRIGADNKYLKIGTGDDLAFVHTGGQSYISNATGHLTGRSASYTFENLAGSTEYFRITSAGRVGILTVTPEARLDVYDTSSLGILSRSASTQATDTNKALKVRNNSTTDTFNVSYKGQGYFAGKVGIGTDNPTTGKLEIADSAQTNLLTLKRTSGNSGELSVQLGGSDPGVMFTTSGLSDDFVFRPGGNERVRIDSSGRVMIGNTQAANMLAAANNLIVGTGSGSEGMTIYSGSGDGGFIAFADGTSDPSYRVGQIIYDHSVNHMVFRVNGNTDRLRIDSSGRLLLGTTTEGEVSADNLTIADSGNCGMTMRSGTSSWASLFFSDATSGTDEFSGAIEYKHNDNYLRFRTNATERLRIQSNGHVGINRTSPTRKLHVAADNDLTSFTGTSYGIIAIENSQYDSGDYNAIDFTYNGSNNPVSRIASKITGSGSSLHFGTSNDYGSGITNEAFRIGITGKVAFASVKTTGNQIVHNVSTADVEIGGRHIWKRIESSNHVTTSTTTNHFYLAFFRNPTGNQHTSYYRGVVVNVIAGGLYDWGGHGYVTHSSQTILSFGSNTTGVHNTVYNKGFNQIHNNSANMQLHNVAYSYDSNYLYANFRFKTNLSGTGFKPYYNVEVIDPSQCLYTCVAI